MGGIKNNHKNNKTKKMENLKTEFEPVDVNYLTLRDYFASQAMLAVMQETQEMKIGSFWDWIKLLLVTYLHFNFLTVKFVKVKNVYEEAAVRAYEYADALIKIRTDKKQS